MNRKPIKLYRALLSGHCHRVQLMLSLLGLDYETIEVDLDAGEHKQAPFLAMNAFAQVPVINDNGFVLADSNAILVYLVKQYGGQEWLPLDPQGAAHVQRWLSAAAGPVAYGLCRARLVTVFGAPYDAEEVIAHSHQYLKSMESELSHRPWLAGETVTLADIANYSYVAHVPEGNVSLQTYPNIRAWVKRLENFKRFVPMVKSNVGLVS
ncbi:glutathione S-transferase family protein [Pseudomonas petrae]|uniref:Glutathione S-transferase n=1 Tax=Pseudomonas petrae TaxID=2912190 RepID=A0ABS9ID72_9PSED|nr:glutathione S-transferase [Pseudomonas petrae]MCF7545653.1 glutathione S-transferase [Pseudomonas petrae]